MVNDKEMRCADHRRQKARAEEQAQQEYNGKQCRAVQHRAKKPVGVQRHTEQFEGRRRCQRIMAEAMNNKEIPIGHATVKKGPGGRESFRAFVELVRWILPCNVIGCGESDSSKHYGQQNARDYYGPACAHPHHKTYEQEDNRRQQQHSDCCQ